MKLNKDFDTVKTEREGTQKLSNEFNNMSNEDKKKYIKERIKNMKALSPYRIGT